MTARKLRLISEAIDMGIHDMQSAKTDWRNAVLKGDPIVGNSANILRTMAELPLPADMATLLTDLKSHIPMPGPAKCSPRKTKAVAI